MTVPGTISHLLSECAHTSVQLQLASVDFRALFGNQFSWLYSCRFIEVFVL